MGEWKDVCDECLGASEQLRGAGMFRGSVNRAYFAAYAAMTSALRRKIRGFGRWKTHPTHEQLPQLAAANLGGIPKTAKANVRRALLRLRNARIDADYVPEADVDLRLARDCLRDVNFILRALKWERQ